MLEILFVALLCGPPRSHYGMIGKLDQNPVEPVKPRRIEFGAREKHVGRPSCS